ncbi:hypothetical protein [Burkholderia multivorans]|uniref:hypothetical protein n=1 Tax=Burkholderia multivorans TaxID=87883 RepID=UPI0020A3434D|nr:hypothetical protein [Burkholderia multivorans]
MKDDRLETQFRLGSAVIALGSTVADSIARAASNLAETTLLKGRAAVLEVVGSMFRSASKVLGIVAAGINSYWDGKNAIDAYKEKNFALSAALGASAFFGFTTAVLIAFGAVVWVIMSALAFIAAGVVATFLQEDKIERWLKRCYWGTPGKGYRYSDAESEMSKFSIVMGS